MNFRQAICVLKVTIQLVQTSLLFHSIYAMYAKKSDFTIFANAKYAAKPVYIQSKNICPSSDLILVSYRIYNKSEIQSN